MYAFKTLIALGIFTSLVNALPTPHNRIRSACSHKSPANKPHKPTNGTSVVHNINAPESSVTTTSSTPKLSATPLSNLAVNRPANTTSPTVSKSSTGAKGLSALFPVAIKTGNEGWTTMPGVGGALALSDATFRPIKLLKALSHTYVNAPDGKKALKAHYAKGSYTFGGPVKGGFSFYSPGPRNVDLTTAKEVTLGYSVMFEKGFQFAKGGKLPGIYGGDDAETATGCSGGRRSLACFSARFMWRAGGKGEFYTYLPQLPANKKLCTVKPQSVCNPTYGASVGRGAFDFKVGVWNQISERVRLNDVGQANGELELFFNGKSVINVSGLILRHTAKGRIFGIQMQTFFGGSDHSFASPANTNAFFADFSVAITQKL